VTKRQLRLDDLIGPDLPAADRGRLEQAHDLLLLAGRPPELPAALRNPPETVRTLRLVPRASRHSRRAVAAVAAAVAIAVLAGAAGYLTAGHRTQGFSAAALVRMHGTAADPEASATISIGSRDQAGNRPMRLSVKGLPPLPRGSYYTVYLTKNGRPATSCGSFKVDGANTTVIRLNAPYDLDEYGGWIIARQRAGKPRRPTLLTTSLT
jgi:hypothetical protein